MPKHAKKLVAVIALAVGLTVVVPATGANAATVKKSTTTTTSTTKTSSKDYWL